jgi:selenide,water dikinase
MKKLPGGTKRNKDFRLRFVTGEKTADEDLMNILFDPQTSGGLLVAVMSSQAESALSALREAGVPATIIGETVPGNGLIELA